MNLIFSIIVGAACVFMWMVAISFMYDTPKQLKRIADALEKAEELKHD